MVLRVWRKSQKEVINLIFTEPASIAYPLKELSSSCILHHYGQMSGGQNHLQNQNAIKWVNNLIK